MISRQFTHSRFVPFRLSVGLAMALAVIGIGLGDQSASGLEWMYVSMGNNTIVRYDVSLADSSAVSASANTFVNTGQGLNSPFGLAFDTAGNLYAANYGNNTITKYDSSGAYGGTPFVPAGQGLSSPLGLAFDTSGRLYAANSLSSTVTRYDSSGNRIGTDFVVIGFGFASPSDLAFDSSGKLYVANYGQNPTVTQPSGAILRYDTAGNEIGTSISGGVNGPAGLAFDSAGNLYAANQGNNTITRYDSLGNQIGGNFVNSPLNAPKGMAFDTAGNFYVANQAINMILKYNSAGVLQFGWSTGASPRNLAFVPEPSTYVLAALATGLMAVIARRRKAVRRG